jgi:hypothetical protein
LPCLFLFQLFLFKFYFNINFFSIYLSNFHDTTLQLDPDLRLSGLTLHPYPRLLGRELQSYPFKLGSCKFNIIINIKNIITCIINIIIFIIMNIVNIIINKFEKILLILKNNHRFHLNGKIKNYKNLSYACLIL